MGKILQYFWTKSIKFSGNVAYLSNMVSYSEGRNNRIRIWNIYLRISYFEYCITQSLFVVPSCQLLSPEDQILQPYKEELHHHMAWHCQVCVQRTQCRYFCLVQRFQQRMNQKVLLPQQQPCISYRDLMISLGTCERRGSLQWKRMEKRHLPLWSILKLLLKYILCWIWCSNFSILVSSGYSVQD